MSRGQDQRQHQDQDQRQDRGGAAPRHGHALDLDQPPIQAAVFEYLAVLGEGLERVAKAVALGNRGRRLALEELAIVSVLVHYLRRRLSELEPARPAPTETAPDEADEAPESASDGAS